MPTCALRVALLLDVLVFTPVHTFRKESTRNLKSQVVEIKHRNEDNAEDGKPLRVLTYNMCWGCMESDTADRTGMQGHLRKECSNTDGSPGPEGENGMGIPITRCAKNMGEAIARYHSQVGNGAGYDLMAFQEASNFDSLGLLERGVNLSKKHFGGNLPFRYNKGVHKGQPKKAWVVSLYNERVFGKPNETVSGVEASDPGRPYLILIFDIQQLIFVNIHNCQPHSGSSWEGFIGEMMPKLTPAFQAKPDRKQYRVILAGDFNDLSSKLPGTLSVPWNGASLDLEKPLAKSCCYPPRDPESMLPGDYIFDSHATVHNQVPPSFDSKVAQSDHWPVEAELNPLTGQLSPLHDDKSTGSGIGPNLFTGVLAFFGSVFRW